MSAPTAAPAGNSSDFLAALAAYDRNGALPGTADDTGFMQALAAYDRGQQQRAPGAPDPDDAANPDQAQQSAPAPQDWTDRLAALAGRYAGPFGQQLVRQTGLAGRAVAEAAQHTANVIPDAANAVLQLATNPQARAATLAQLSNPSTWLTMPANAPSSIVSHALAQALPTPQSGPERFSSLVEQMLAGSRMPMFPGASQPTAAASVARSGLTGAERDAAAAGRALGMRLTPGQATGSRALQQVESHLESNPWTSAPFNALKAGNQAVLNRTAAQAIGENADTVDSSVLSRAADRLAGVFAHVRTPNHTIMFDPESTKAALDGIDQEFSGLLPNDMAIRDNALVGQLDRLASNGHTTAQQLGQLSSKLGKAAFKQMTSPAGDRDLGQALYGVKDHVDDLLESSLTGDERAEYAAARGQYRQLMNLTSRSSIVNPSSGNVSGTALASKLQQADKPGFLFGRNTSPLYQAARFAQAFKPAIGDSGTATRSAGLGILPGIGLALAGHVTGLPLGDAAELGLAPLAARLGSGLASRAYMTRPGAGLVRGALALPGAVGRGTRFALNPLLVPQMTRGPVAPLPMMLPPIPPQAHVLPRRPPLIASNGGAVHVKHGPGRHSTYLPSAFGPPQRLDGIVTVDNGPRNGLLGMRP